MWAPSAVAAFAGAFLGSAFLASSFLGSAFLASSFLAGSAILAARAPAEPVEGVLEVDEMHLGDGEAVLAKPLEHLPLVALLPAVGHRRHGPSPVQVAVRRNHRTARGSYPLSSLLYWDASRHTWDASKHVEP